jgi:diaminohydroxyphosphoribosylaminopyrimidine deaminase/5-amino-6-(5-phosphoribosylamino)uracil reductase
VLDGDLRLPANARMLKEAGTTLVFTASPDAGRADKLRNAGAQVERIDRTGRGSRSPCAPAARCTGRQRRADRSGSTLNGALLEAGLVDELVLYVAPRILGRHTRGLFELPDLLRLDQAVTFELVETRRVGADMRVRARPAK